MTSKFIISLDFELMWGMHDHKTIADYGEAVLGVRDAIPQLLEEFKTFGIEATWATVGLLFARNQSEMLEFAPELRPGYHNQALSPYQAIDEFSGQDENTNPYFFGRSLLDRIIDAGTHEISCHTYSHYFCLEPGQSVEQFRADLAANIAIADAAGCKMETVVFPRNQWGDDYIDAIVDAGLIAFRGNQGGIMYRSRAGARNTLLVRGLRLADGALPLASATDFASPSPHRGAINIPASRFLRPWKPTSKYYNSMHVRRIKGEMSRAAQLGTHYHLWWHPHNMGRHAEGNFAQLRQILEHYRNLRAEHGMESATMANIAHSMQVKSL